MSKTCAVCGTDCANMPRVKDPAGHYYCRPCYDRAVQAKRERKAAEKAARARELPQDLMLEGLEIPDEPAASGIACPGCGTLLGAGSALCTSCGHRLDGGAAPAPAPRRPAADGEPKPWLWPVYLYVMPSRFFRQFAGGTPALIAVLFFWMFGMAAMNDQLEARRAIASVRGATFFLANTWSAHWGVVAVAGALSGLLAAGVGGWWYRVRIGWSGDRDPGLWEARRVYVLASMVWVFPALLAVSYASLSYATPEEAANHFTVFDGLVLLAGFWCLFTSYKGVRATFDVKRWRALFWFLILPGAIQVLALIVLIAAVVAIGLAASLGPADLSNPQTFRSATMSFQYPGNWWIDIADPDHDPDSYVGVEPLQDGYLRIMIYDSEISPEAELAATLDQMAVELSGVRQGRTIEGWGQFGGVGRTLQASSKGVPVTVTVFVAPLGGGSMLEIHETSAMGDFTTVQPGFDLVRRSLTVN